jgi:hypothetical protein
MRSSLQVRKRPNTVEINYFLFLCNGNIIILVWRNIQVTVRAQDVEESGYSLPFMVDLAMSLTVLGKAWTKYLKRHKTLYVGFSLKLTCTGTLRQVLFLTHFVNCCLSNLLSDWPPPPFMSASHYLNRDWLKYNFYLQFYYAICTCLFWTSYQNLHKENCWQSSSAERQINAGKYSCRADI